MIATFSYHATERISERLGKTVTTRTRVDLNATFILAKTYPHHDRSRGMMQAWVSRNANKPIVLIVSECDSVVITVLLGEELTGRRAPFVAECLVAARRAAARAAARG